MIYQEHIHTVSVAMTTYNAGSYLLEQLHSLWNQTRRPDEVIICDDGSTDNTVSLIRTFIQDKGLTGWQLVCNTENLGFIRNFQKAIRLTHGDVVFLCDQDDVWDLEKVEKMVSAMEANTKIEALACGYRHIGADGRPLRQEPKKFYKPPHGAALLSPVKAGHVFYYNIAQGCACCYRRSLIDQYCGIPCGNHLPHDWTLNLLAYQKDAFYFWKEPLLSYRLHGGNAIGAAGMRRNIFQRATRVRASLICLEEILFLPISAEDAEEYRKIIRFFQLRIRILQKRNPLLWLKTYIQYRSLIKNEFFMQYIKDLILLPLLYFRQ